MNTRAWLAKNFRQFMQGQLLQMVNKIYTRLTRRDIKRRTANKMQV